MGTERFRERGEHRFDFLEEVLIECPGCGGCAVHRAIDPTQGNDPMSPRRLLCRGCGYSRDWTRSSLVRGTTGAPIDDYFELPLWLQMRCCGDFIWEYNEAHLSFLEGYLGARLRERSKDEDGNGWSNQSVASRLPPWMKKGSNRAEVVRWRWRRCARSSRASADCSS